MTKLSRMLSSSSSLKYSEKTLRNLNVTFKIETPTMLPFKMSFLPGRFCTKRRKPRKRWRFSWMLLPLRQWRLRGFMYDNWWDEPLLLIILHINCMHTWTILTTGMYYSNHYLLSLINNKEHIPPQKSETKYSRAANKTVYQKNPLGGAKILLSSLLPKHKNSKYCRWVFTN